MSIKSSKGRIWKVEKNGSSLFRVGDIIRFDELIQKINNNSDALSVYIKTQFSQKGKDFLNNYAPSTPVLDKDKSILIKELNKILEDVKFYDEKRFSSIELRDKTKASSEKFVGHQWKRQVSKCMI